MIWCQPPSWASAPPTPLSEIYPHRSDRGWVDLKKRTRFNSPPPLCWPSSPSPPPTPLSENSPGRRMRWSWIWISRTQNHLPGAACQGPIYWSGYQAMVRILLGVQNRGAIPRAVMKNLTLKHDSFGENMQTQQWGCLELNIRKLQRTFKFKSTTVKSDWYTICFCWFGDPGKDCSQGELVKTLHLCPHLLRSYILVLEMNVDLSFQHPTFFHLLRSYILILEMNLKFSTFVWPV